MRKVSCICDKQKRKETLRFKEAEMNKWAELVMAWVVGGLVGRLIGHTYLVGQFDLPEVFGWLSVPIGSVLAWLAVELKAIAPAFKHTYRWTKKPTFIDSLYELPTLMKSVVKNQWEKFGPARGWKTLNCVLLGILISTWLILTFMIWYELGFPHQDAGKTLLAILGPTVLATFAFGFIPLFSIAQLLEKKNLWTITDYNPHDYPKKTGILTLTVLVFNPIGIWIVGGAIFCFYWFPLGVKEIVVWLGKVIWKTIRMVNSSQRMAAMTGAAIGLSISQIYGFNPVICSGVCVLSGLAERFVFTLTEKAVLRLRVRQTA